jgi:hypothetical protein
VSRAQARWPSASLETLTAGRETYVARCAGCHSLQPPKSQQADAWPKHLDKMQVEAKLKEPERELIEQYLVTLAARP